VSANNKADNDYVHKSGSSMACPHVAGVAARILQKAANASPSEVWDILRTDFTVHGTIGAHSLSGGTTDRRLSLGTSSLCNLARCNCRLSGLLLVVWLAATLSTLALQA